MPNGARRSAEFCNSFWGEADAGVDVLLARMRHAAQTTSELRRFWEERAAIEEEYAARLAKLAKATLGTDEIGELRNCLDTLRLETDMQARFHRGLAEQVRGELAAPANALVAKQDAHRDTQQAAIEKRFRAKRAAESYVAKARAKFDGDSARIATYTAQARDARGDELARMHAKLARARAVMAANGEDLARFQRALGELQPKWETDWKEFCDSCQDLEEERLEFTRENLWTYANAVSTLCVADDQSCEKVRVALDHMEPERDMQNFIRDFATGNALPPLHADLAAATAAATAATTDAPSDAAAAASAAPAPAPAPRLAEFVRASARPAPVYQAPEPAPAPHQSIAPHQGARDDGAARPNGHRRGPSMSWLDPDARASLPGAPRPPPPAAAPAPANRVSVAPAARVPENQPVIFYVKALYDYTATAADEFDFQEGDVIAVTATPDDGWWHGELLDEARRRPGRAVFPSNFVVLF